MAVAVAAAATAVGIAPAVAAAAAAAPTLLVVAAVLALVLHVFLGAVQRVRDESTTQFGDESSAAATAVRITAATASSAVTQAHAVFAIVARAAIALALATAGFLAMLSERSGGTAFAAFTGTTRSMAMRGHYIYNKYFI